MVKLYALSPALGCQLKSRPLIFSMFLCRLSRKQSANQQECPKENTYASVAARGRMIRIFCRLRAFHQSIHQERSTNCPHHYSMPRLHIRPDHYADYSVLSFSLAACVVCHCMFDGLSAPPRLSG